MSGKSNEELHRELWGWLAETGSDKKWEWPGWVEVKKEPYERVFIAVHNDCFACQEASDTNTSTIITFCFSCPLDFGTGYGKCSKEGSLYDKWGELIEGCDEKKKLAAQIRDLPWRER